MISKTGSQVSSMCRNTRRCNHSRRRPYSGRTAQYVVAAAMNSHMLTSIPLANASSMKAASTTISSAATIATGIATYWSRSRRSLWRKGETSGNEQQVVELRTDCDQDVVWLVVRTAGHGANCHTGRHSCFYRRVEVLVNVDNPALQSELQTILDLNLTDDVLAWELDADGNWTKVPTVRGVNLQERLQDHALAQGR